MEQKIMLTEKKTILDMKPNNILSLCEKCGEREATHEHHTIFDKETNKSDKNSPIQNLCALCHAEIHGISPKMSELRMLVTEYSRVQKTRIIYDNSMRGFKYIEMKIPEFFQQQSKNLNDYEKLLSKKIKKFLEGKDQKFIETHHNNVFPIYNWLKKIKGISHLLSAQLIAYIDIDKFDKVSSLWHYCGMHVVNGVAPKRSKGNKIDWNPNLRMICYKISDSFVKKRTPKYREIYDREKEKQLILLDEANTSAPKSKLHAERRSRRKAVKEFLKDMFLKWKKLNKEGGKK